MEAFRCFVPPPQTGPEKPVKLYVRPVPCGATIEELLDGRLLAEHLTRIKSTLYYNEIP